MFKFLPLGGVGYIGGNISFMEMDGFSFLIDTGILFPRESSLGIDHLYPDLSILNSAINSPPEYLILTHAHEDHLGGIKHLLKIFPKIKIVCSPYTTLFINKKFPKLNIKLLTLEEFKKIKKSPSFEFFKVRHSIPGVVGFFLKDKCNKKALLFCTDFRFDSKETDPSYLNPTLLKRFSNEVENIIAFVDSTNISTSKTNGPFEKDLFQNIKQSIQSSNADTYLTLFPSNVNRMASVIKACNSLGKSCCLAGFSVEFNYSLGLEANLIEPIHNSVYSEGNSVIILSGSQGDLRGAFRRVFSLNDKKYKPKLNDWLLFSSKIIPGNEISVNDLFNKASLIGVSINKGAGPVIHSSGHAYLNEINEIISFLEPDSIVPIHLESSFFQDFQTKVSQVYPDLKIHHLENHRLLESSNFIDFSLSQLGKYDPLIFLDGGEVCDKGVINSRRRLGNLGSLFISINSDKENSVKISHYGIPEIKLSGLKTNINQNLVSEWGNPDLQEVLRVSTRLYLNKVIGYKPLVFVHIL